MRRFLVLLMILILVMTVSVGVSAATVASGVSSFAAVASDGSCQVSMTVAFHLEEAVEKLYYPVPAEATGISLNGSRVSAAKDGDARNVNISRVVRNVVGDCTVSIQYTLHDVIHTTEAGTLEMRVPMLSGFAYPIEKLEFSLTMPGVVEVLPAFVSGYHQARIEEYLTYGVEGATVTGSSLKAMKDHETLTMSMVVTEQMFPQSIVQSQDYHWGITAMGICAALALLYWLIFLWNLPARPQSSTEPPQGYSAGQLGCIAAGQGVDLTMTVFSWAQLGYVLIQIDRRNRVLLHKQMDMGNERSEFEQRCFKKLFGKRDLVDTSGFQYAQFCRLAAKRPEGVGELMGRFNGSPTVFRVIASAMGLFGGASLAVALANGAALQGFLIFLLGVAGGVSGWYMQEFGKAVLLGNRRALLVSLGNSTVWLVLSLIAGAAGVGAWMVAGLLTAGVLLARGGRRTELGRQTRAQVMGLRWYLHTADKKDLQRICEADPDYFFRLAPYALALGADRAFAKRFGNRKLDRCPYLTTGMDAHMTALQWSAMMRNAEDSMNGRAQRLPLEKLIRMIRSITRG